MNSIGRIHGMEKPIFWSLFSVFAVSAACYMFFVSNVIFNIVERRAVENDTRILSTKISEMELSYLNETRNINALRATELGFSEPKQMGYASRKTFSTKDSKVSSNEI